MNLYEILILIFVGIFEVWLLMNYFRFKSSKIVVHRLKIYFVCRKKTKLILNEEQYGKFMIWLFSADEVFDISDECNRIILIRKHIACVEMKRRKN